MTGEVHVYAPEAEAIALRRRDCPTCPRRSWMIGVWTVWHGWHITCLGCGDQWMDGELLERPFAPRWREKSKRSARKHYRRLRAKGVKHLD